MMTESDFVPKLLTEDPPPEFAANCHQCELSGQRQRVVWGEGNPQAPIFMILDNPGLREDKEGTPFVCGTREALQYGIREVGIDLDLVYVTYLLKCRPIRAYDKPTARAACSSHLQFQLDEYRPRILFGMGNVVVQTLMANEDVDVKSLRGQRHFVRGLPAIFSYHPLAVRRRPVLMKYFVEDLQLLAATYQLLNE